MLTTQGRVFQWGDIGYDREREAKVCEISFLSGSDNKEKERIIQIACGEFHALALTSKGQVYAWGCEDEGQLGIGDEDQVNITGPTKVSGMNGFNSRISQIACGAWTSFALDKDGSVWG